MKTIPILLLLHLTNCERRTGSESKKESVKKNRFLESVGPPPQHDLVFAGPSFYDNNIDPATGLKTPVDFLEMRMVYPQTEEEKRHILKTKPLKDIQFISKPTISPLFYNPRDRIMSNLKNETKANRLPLFLNFESLQSKNLNLPPNIQKSATSQMRTKPKQTSSKEEVDNVASRFYQNSFAFDPLYGYTKLNWTTCDEFKRKSLFHPKDLLNIDWMPFYVWSVSKDAVAVIHKFSVPSIKTVKRYKEEYGPYLSNSVDWNQPKLLMENHEETLLIAADQRGLFHAIKDQKVSDYIKTHSDSKYPVLSLRMKIMDPYLALMYCDDYYATMMAVRGEEPTTDEEKTTEAKILNFNGTGYPVSMDMEMETRRVEWKRLSREREENSKYIQIRDEDYVVEKDKYMDRW